MLINYENCCDIIRSCHTSSIKKILHVGAHTGEEAESYLKNGAEEIIWFEANQSLIPTLESHLKLLPMKQQIASLALWDKNEALKFKVTNNFQSSSFFDLSTHKKHYPGIKVTEEQEIMAYRLDTIIDSGGLIFNDFEFINIDTQGAELAILKGMGNYIQMPSIKGIYLEVNKEELYKGIPLVSDIDAYLSTYNFLRIKSRWTNAGWGDALYVRSNNEEYK